MTEFQIIPLKINTNQKQWSVILTFSQDLSADKVPQRHESED